MLLLIMSMLKMMMTLMILILAWTIMTMIQKVFGKAELGGDTVMKRSSSGFLVLLWITFIIISTLKAYGVISNPFSM